MTKTLKGIAASDGIAIAPAYLLVEPDLSFSKSSVDDVEAEVFSVRYHVFIVSGYLGRPVDHRRAEVEQAVVEQCLDDDFVADTVEVAVGDTHFYLVHRCEYA